MNTFGYVGAAITIFGGIIGLMFPDRVSRTIGLSLNGRLGRSEFRATYGGLFLAAGVAAINAPDSTLLLACAWLGAAAGRSISAIIDRSWSKENVAGIIIELAVGSLLLTSA
ncbi:MAG: putative rane protein [Gemmatimonadota bacterium]